MPHLPGDSGDRPCARRLKKENSCDGAHHLPDWRKAALLEDLAAIRRRWSALPVLDARSIDEIIGYDQNGLPR